MNIFLIKYVSKSAGFAKVEVLIERGSENEFKIHQNPLIY